jgi:hypothetical protein
MAKKMAFYDVLVIGHSKQEAQSVRSVVMALGQLGFYNTTDPNGTSTRPTAKGLLRIIFESIPTYLGKAHWANECTSYEDIELQCERRFRKAYGEYRARNPDSDPALVVSVYVGTLKGHAHEPLGIAYAQLMAGEMLIPSLAWVRTPYIELPAMSAMTNSVVFQVCSAFRHSPAGKEFFRETAAA